MQLTDAIPKTWKLLVQGDNSHTLSTYEQGLTTGARYRTLEYLTAKEIYSIIIRKKKHIPSSQKYFNNLFSKETLDWKRIYMLPRKTTYDTYSRVFQYKILNNILYLNEKLHLFKKIGSPKCSFCHLFDETQKHIFVECLHSKRLWTNLQTSMLPIRLPNIDLQSAMFGFYEPKSANNTLLINHLIIIF